MNPFAQKVLDYVRTMEAKWQPINMAILAEGIVAVVDVSGECDAYFDTSLWRFTMPKLWQSNEKLNAMGIEVLQGIGRAPQVHTLHEMIGFAREHIESKRWHAQPIPVKT